MTDQEINEQMSVLVKNERLTTVEILKLINLAEERKLHLSMAYGSLLDWLVKEHKYSEAAAYRRINAARLLKSVPEVSNKIEEGSVNLSTLAKAQTYIRTQEKVSGKKVSEGEKAETINKIENKSILGAEQALIAQFPNTASEINQDRLTVVDENTQRLSVNLPNEVVEELKRVAELLSHKMPNAKFGEIIGCALKYYIKKEDPLVKEQKNSAAVARGANVSKGVKHVVIKKAEGCCEFVDERTGRRCGARYQMETDHRIPKAHGGSNRIENLRGLCKKHNLYMSEKILGRNKANQWRNTPRPTQEPRYT